MAKLLAQRSQESLASFLSFREALEGVMRTVETWANVETGDEVTEFVARLTKEAAADARAVADQAAEESRPIIESLRKRVSALEADVQGHKEKAQAFAVES